MYDVNTTGYLISTKLAQYALQISTANILNKQQTTCIACEENTGFVFNFKHGRIYNIHPKLKDQTMQSFINNPYETHLVLDRTHLNSTKEIKTVWKVKSKLLRQINSAHCESHNVSCHVKPMFNFLPNVWRTALSVFCTAICHRYLELF